VVAVVGAGTMGHGIAQVFAMKGYRVNLADISQEALKRAIERISWSLGRLASKGEIREEDARAALERITTTTDISKAVEGAKLVIEAVYEDIDVKIDVFRRVGESAPAEAILASNTSGLPITAMAEAVRRPEKVVGMHWFNPPQLMKLVEVTITKYTDNSVASYVVELARQLGKTPILVRKDIRGFVANRIYRAIRYEAFAMVLRGEHTHVEIDSALRYKLGLPMGVFELVDFTGAVEIEVMEDRHLGKLRERYPEWEPHYEYLLLRDYAITLSKSYYERGLLGVKTGRGFYEYPEPGKYVKPNIPREAGEVLDPLEVVAPAVNLAAWMIDRGVCTAEEVDLALRLGYNFPRGLIEVARERGFREVIDVLRKKRDRWKGHPYSAFYEPHPALEKILGG